jgi:hypothetical protein
MLEQAREQCRESIVTPKAAFFDDQAGEFILP